jgi:hypothetical protein
MRSLTMVARTAVQCECREMSVRLRAVLSKIVVHRFEHLKCYRVQRSWWKS